MSSNRWTYKHILEHSYNEILFNDKKNWTIKTQKTWINHKWILLSERNQSEKAIYYMITITFFFSHIILVNNIFCISMPQLKLQLWCLVVNMYKHIFRDQEIFMYISTYSGTKKYSIIKLLNINLLTFSVTLLD